MIFGVTDYIAAGAVVMSLGWGGYQTIQRQQATLNLERAQVAEATAKANLANCAARIANIQEAEQSNAEIPDDLRDFVIPPGWLFPNSDSPAPGD